MDDNGHTPEAEPTPGTNGAGHARPPSEARKSSWTEEQLAKPVRYKDLRAIFDGLGLLDRLVKLERATGLSPTDAVPGVESVAPVILNFINARLAPIERRVNELDRDVMKYMGVWLKEKTYTRGAVTTHAGALWFAMETTDSRPGTNGDWKLTVKSGHAPEQKRAD